MSLDSRLRADLREIAATVDPAPEAALRAVLARRDRQATVRLLVLRFAAAASVLLAATLVWWLYGRGSEAEVVTDPRPPDGTYEANLGGDLGGDWRIRFGSRNLSLLAPDTSLLGARVELATYEVHDGLMTTDLLADGPCTGPGAYTWAADATSLTFRVEDDDCGLRVRLLTSSTWSTVTGEQLSEGTYQTPPLTLAKLRATALTAGFSAADVDEELATLGGARSVTYTVQVKGGIWTEYETLDDGAPTVGWSGTYAVVDAATVVAGEPPCGPVTYDYRIDGDRVAFVVLADECVEGGATPVGELVAQATIYQTAPFVRLDP